MSLSLLKRMLEKAYDKAPEKNINFICDDFNAKVGREEF